MNFVIQCDPTMPCKILLNNPLNYKVSKFCEISEKLMEMTEITETNTGIHR